MTTRRPPGAAKAPVRGAPVASTPRPPLTLQERMRDIELMRQRVNGYADYMAGVEALAGTSTEAKEKAIVAFHERMTVLEGHLARIHDELRLG